jgi:hypothetical protein
MQNRISSLRRKKEPRLMCYVKTNCIHFAKIDNHNTESGTTVKSLLLGNSRESVQIVFAFPSPNDLITISFVLYYSFESP